MLRVLGVYWLFAINWGRVDLREPLASWSLPTQPAKNLGQAAIGVNNALQHDTVEALAVDEPLGKPEDQDVGAIKSTSP